MKKVIAFAMALVLTAVVSIAGTVAYLQDSGSDVNVMTLGNVHIEQIEQERIDTNALPGEDNLQDYTQDKPLLPSYFAGSSIPWNAASEADQAWKVVETTDNVVDKFVTVKNTGDTAAYVRTIIAYEGDDTYGPEGAYIHVIHNGSNVDPQIDIEMIGVANIDGVDYTLYVYTYPEALAAGETSIPSLKQVYMNKAATNEVVAVYGDTYEILVYSQAVQTDMNGLTAAEALDEAFQPITTTNHPWMDGVVIPNYVADAEELTEALAEGGNVVLTGDISTGSNYVTIPADSETVIDLNGYTISSEGDSTAICNEGDLTITGDGTIEAGWNAVWNNGGILTIDGGVLKGDYSAVYSEGGVVSINGGELAVTADNGYNAAVYVAEGAHMVVNGGTITTEIENTRLLDIRNSSTVLINDGTFIGTKSDAYEMGDIYVGDCQDENAFVIDGGVFDCTISTNYKLTIYGGIFNDQIYTSSIVPADYTLTINGGTFNLTSGQIMVGGNGWKFQINDGTFASTQANVYVERPNAGSGFANIVGGTFAE